MKTTVKTSLAALVLAIAATCGVHAAEKQSIAVFDVQQVISGTNAAKRAISDLTGKRNAAQEKIDSLEKPLIEKQQKLRSQQSVMAADKFQQAQADFAKELNGFRQEAQKIQGDLDEQNFKLRKKIADAVKDAVESIAKEKGYDLVLPKGAVSFASPNVPDISTEVLARANKALDK